MESVVCDGDIFLNVMLFGEISRLSYNVTLIAIAPVLSLHTKDPFTQALPYISTYLVEITRRGKETVNSMGS